MKKEKFWVSASTEVLGPPRVSTNSKHSKVIDLLAKIAFSVEPVAAARIAAAVVYKNDIIAVGTNKFKTHPFQAKFSKHPSSIHLHAETDAIKNALKILSQHELSKATLYIVRIKFFDEFKKKMVFGLAKPCPGCMKAIATFNINKVIYSLDFQGYESV